MLRSLVPFEAPVAEWSPEEAIFAVLSVGSENTASCAGAQSLMGEIGRVEGDVIVGMSWYVVQRSSEAQGLSTMDWGRCVCI